MATSGSPGGIAVFGETDDRFRVTEHGHARAPTALIAGESKSGSARPGRLLCTAAARLPSTEGSREGGPLRTIACAEAERPTLLGSVSNGIHHRTGSVAGHVGVHPLSASGPPRRIRPVRKVFAFTRAIRTAAIERDRRKQFRRGAVGSTLVTRTRVITKAGSDLYIRNAESLSVDARSMISDLAPLRATGGLGQTRCLPHALDRPPRKKTQGGLTRAAVRPTRPWMAGREDGRQTTGRTLPRPPHDSLARPPPRGTGP
jgi:hypothetical protein